MSVQRLFVSWPVAACCLALCWGWTDDVAGQGILYVDDDAPTGGDGLAWGTAFRHPQSALDAADADPTIGEIRIGAGVYRPIDMLTPGQFRTASFRLVDGVRMRGSFAGYDAGKPDEQDLDAHPAILTGDMFLNDGPDFSNREDNVYQVVQSQVTEFESTLEAFVISGGQADGPGAFGTGGGLYVALSSVIVVDCRFIDNSGLAGGAANLDRSDGTFIGCAFENNAAQDRGGAFLSTESVLSFATCTFRSNRSNDRGGAIYADVVSIEAINCLFDGNAVVEREGGGLYLNDCGLALHDCTFQGNQCGDDEWDGGGGFALWGGPGAVIASSRFIANQGVVGAGFVVHDAPQLLVSDCLFDANSGYGASLLNVSEAEVGTSEFVNGAGGAISISESMATIQDCHFNDNINDAGRAGAIYGPASHLMISRCVFRRNQSVGYYEWAGAVNLPATSDGGSAVITSCLFEKNAGRYGGGVSFGDKVDLVVSDCNFHYNAAYSGGGLCNINGGGSLVCGDCRFVGNRGLTGGAVVGQHVDAVIEQCEFVDNFGTGLAFGATGRISQCLFLNNHAAGHDGAGHSGGALQLGSDANCIVENCALLGNTALRAGGAVKYAHGSDVLMVGCLIAGNRATLQGTASGGGIFTENATISLVSCTVAYNSAAYRGGGIDADQGGATLQNCVLWGNSVDGSVDFGTQLSSYNNTGTYTVDYSCVHGLTGELGGIGNLGVDPLFMDPEGPDDVIGTIDDDFRLSYGSACIDAGINAAIPNDELDLDEDENTSERVPLDLAGLSRFADVGGQLDAGCGNPVVVDLGAYEFQSAPVGNVMPGDVDGDIDVDADDLFRMLGEWGEATGGCFLGDVDFSGTVDASDLAILLGNWGD